MPDKILVVDPADSTKTYSISIGYKGKGYFCARCQEKHVGECPVKRAFYEEKEFRATQTITQTILADSTLRLADTTGLCADIICMSGGRVGHIAHMLKDAPHMQSMEKIVVVAGANDIHREGESEAEFATKVSKAVGNFQHQIYSTNQSLTFVEPPLPPDLTPLAKRKKDRLDILFMKLSKVHQHEFTVLPCPQGLPMDNGHLTEAGTKDFLKFIDSTIPIIHNQDYITTARLYTGVATAFRYGCLLCLEHLELNGHSICPACAKLEAPDPTLLTDKGDTDTVPPLEVHMSERDNKRLSKDHSESTPSKLIKSHDGNDT